MVPDRCHRSCCGDAKVRMVASISYAVRRMFRVGSGIAAGGKTLPQLITLSSGPADRRDGRLLTGVDRRDKGPLEAVIVKPDQISLQSHRRAFVRMQYRRAKLGAGAAKKFEPAISILPSMEPVDLTGDPEHRQPVGVVKRHGIAQHRQVPGAQGAGKPLHAMNIRTHPRRAWDGVTASS